MNSPKSKYEWFSEWFDSPYYHLLYFHRDETDARNFINTLTAYLKLSGEAEVLDLACGRGRHAIYLASLGYRVTGLDLSPHNIQLAGEKAGGQVDFRVHDMRDPLPGTYDLVLNLFTSFGYFNTKEEHITALKNIRYALKPGGYFILDYLNAAYVKRHLVKHNTLNIEGVEFDLTRRLNGAYIEKDIVIRDGHHPQFYQEKVRAFTNSELIDLATKAGFNVEEVWGSYGMDVYDEEESQRLILKCSPA